MRETIIRERDLRVIFELHHVITRYCVKLGYADAAYIYARMLARFVADRLDSDEIYFYSE